MQAINRLAEEIQRANIQSVIIVHGGGSFGHPLAQRYAIVEGFKEETQKTGFSETHHVMTVLNGLFMDALIWRNIPAVSITPSSCIITKNGRIQYFEDVPLKMMLKMGFLPVLYGDAVLDSSLGFAILSGDQLVSVLATKLNAERVIIGVDVDGLYLQSKLDKPAGGDVTGGMFGKMAELFKVVEQGIPVTIVNASKPNYIYKALKREKVKSTLIENG